MTLSAVGSYTIRAAVDCGPCGKSACGYVDSGFSCSPGPRPCTITQRRPPSPSARPCTGEEHSEANIDVLEAAPIIFLLGPYSPFHDIFSEDHVSSLKKAFDTLNPNRILSLRQCVHRLLYHPRVDTC